MSERYELLGGYTDYVKSEGNLKSVHSLPLPLDGRHDLHSLRLPSVPDELERVAVHIGKQPVLEWECGINGINGINAPEGVNLLPLVLCDAPHVLPTSLSGYMTAEIILHYREDFVLANEEWSTVEEENDQEEYSDTAEEFFDGSQVLWGRRVHRSTVPTGRLVRKVTCGAQVRIPTVEITLVEPPSPEEDYNVLVAFWQKIVVPPEDREYALRLARDHRLREVVPDASDWYAPRAFVVENHIRFTSGMAGVTHRY